MGENIEMKPPANQETGKGTLLGFAVAALLYFLAAAYLVSRSLNVMTADAVSYLRIAQYYADGRFDLAVNSCWGPMLSWLLVPAALLKFDLTLAVRIVQVLSGFGFAVSVAILTRRFTGGRGALLGFVTGALLALPMIPYSITPDMTLAFLITLYFALMAPLLSSGSLRWALGAGIVAGLAFLTKHYALPFVLGHMLLTLSARWILVRKNRLEGPVARFILVAGAAMLALALPWIIVMSLHDGTFTISSLAPFAKAVTYSTRHHLIFPNHHLQEPREGRIVVSENRLEGVYGPPKYPPLASGAGLKDQIGHFKYYGPHAIAIVKSADLLGLLFCAAIIVLYRALRSTGFLLSREGIHGVWVCCSVGLYVTGYVLTNVEDRLLWPAWGILLALAISVFVLPPERQERGAMAVSSKWFWGLLLVGSAGFNAGDAVNNGGKNLTWYADCRKAAETLPFEGHFAVNGKSEQILVAYAVAYWSDTPLLGCFQGQTADAVAEELKPFGDVQALIISAPDLVSRLTLDPRFKLLGTRTGESKRYTYTLFAFRPL